MKFFHNNFQNILFTVGLILTFWRSYACLQKYLYSNLSTKVTMESSFDIVRPSVVICPTFEDSFKIWIEILFLNNAIIKAPTAPSDAASDGVATPKIIEPRTTTVSYTHLTLSTILLV